MSDDKYEFTDEVIEIDGKTLRRIKALRDFGSIKAGDIGGFIQHLDNLSQFGDCWVEDNACVFDDAAVMENAVVGGHARVHDKAIIGDNAYIAGTAEICGRARLSGRTYICNNVIVREGR